MLYEHIPHHTMASSNRSNSSRRNGNRCNSARLVFDMSSIQPFSSAKGKGDNSRASVALSKTTAATSSSEDSRNCRTGRGRDNKNGYDGQRGRSLSCRPLPKAHRSRSNRSRTDISRTDHSRTDISRTDHSRTNHSRTDHSRTNQSRGRSLSLMRKDATKHDSPRGRSHSRSVIASNVSTNSITDRSHRSTTSSRRDESTPTTGGRTHSKHRAPHRHTMEAMEEENDEDTSEIDLGRQSRSVAALAVAAALEHVSKTRLEVAASHQRSRSRGPIRPLPSQSRPKTKSTLPSGGASTSSNRKDNVLGNLVTTFPSETTICSTPKIVKRDQPKESSHRHLPVYHNASSMDDDGCCTLHPFVQLQTKLPSGKWRTLSRSCVICREENKPHNKSYCPSNNKESRRTDTGRQHVVHQKPRRSSEHSSRYASDDDCSLSPSCFDKTETPNSGGPKTPSRRTTVVSVSSSHSNDSLEGTTSHEPIPDQVRQTREIRLSTQDDECTVRSKQSPLSSKESAMSPSNSESSPKYKSTTAKLPSIDMCRVQSALQKIKSMEEIPHDNVTAAAPPVRNLPPPPPPPPKSLSIKPFSSKVGSCGKQNNGSANSTGQRPPPPPPPPRPHTKTAKDTEGTTNLADVDHDCSMSVLNPQPEPELQNDYFVGLEPTDVNGDSSDAPNKDWLKYCTTSSTREGNDHRAGERRGKLFGRPLGKHHADCDRQILRSVKQMPFTDQFGDFGVYTGQVNDDGRPDGKGSMKYDNGVFYEGTWSNGCHDQKAALQYERIRGGFTSWQGKGKNSSKSGMVLPWNARKNDAHDPNEKINVRGMEWTDLKGDSGRYTGEVNLSSLPHGFGVMKYDFGLIVEGDWNNGVLKENPNDRLMAAPASGGRSIGPGMSVGPGTMGFGAASVGPLPMGGASVMGGMSMVYNPLYPSYGGVNPLMTAGQHVMIAQQNAMLRGMYGGSVYGGSVYGGSAYGLMNPVQAPPSSEGPPVSEIRIS